MRLASTLGQAYFKLGLQTRVLTFESHAQPERFLPHTVRLGWVLPVKFSQFYKLT